MLYQSCKPLQAQLKTQNSRSYQHGLPKYIKVIQDAFNDEAWLPENELEHTAYSKHKKVYWVSILASRVDLLNQQYSTELINDKQYVLVPVQFHYHLY